MAQTADQELVDRFGQFYRNYYREAIGELAQNYPTEQRSLAVDWNDLYQFDPDLADDYLAQPDQLREYAEEALRVYDLPIDVSLGQAHVRVHNLPDVTEIREIRSRDVNTLVSVQGIVRKATDVRPKIEEAAFECQRCGTLTYVPQSGGFQEPHECQGCERQGPFTINHDQSSFVDAQQLRVQESPEGLHGGETPQSIDVHIEDDITGEVTPGDHVTVTGVLRIEQGGNGNEQSRMFEVFMDGHSVTLEDEEFENMDITEADKQAIVELAGADDIYERMVDSIAPTIYGYEEIKTAIVLQLFSGVTKHLPDDSRIRGDFHMLLIGDPGTGKCVAGDTRVTLADGREVPIRELVEANLDDPTPVDDGVYDAAGFEVPSLGTDGRIVHQDATKVWKREAPDRMYRIRTASGRDIEVTPSHPLFVQAGGRVVPKTAADLSEGEFVATPGVLPAEGDDALDVIYRESESPNAVRLDLPREWTPWLARLLGYIVAEGYVERRPDNTGFVSITNNDEEILGDVAAAFDRLGCNYFERKPHDGKQARAIVCSAGEFVSFLDALEPSLLEGSAHQRVPDALQGASRESKAAFLKAYVESEGHVSADEREITVASTSGELLENVRSLLLTFGIGSQLRARHDGSYRLRISGGDFVTYVEEIGFVTERKATAAAAFDGTDENTNTDVIPGIGDTLRRIRKTLELSQFECGVPRTTYQHYERGDRNPSRSSLRAVVAAFEDRLKWLRDARDDLESGAWGDIGTIRRELNVSQRALADGMDVTRTAVSHYEREAAVPDGGHTEAATAVLRERIDTALTAADDVAALRTLVDGDAAWDRIESIEETVPEYDWVYDLEVEGTHNYIANNVVSHNSKLLQYIRNIAPRSVYTSGKGSSSAGLTAAAVRDDFGDGQQWTLEAGALVLADRGIAAVDELDKMDANDRSALHEALEQQSVSISKAGINATLKSRCSLLGAANPKYGRFDQYEPIAEQIELDPALISRFDLIFTVTDQPDEEEDRRLAEHILETNYAGELNTQQTELNTPNAAREEVESVTREVEPSIEPELFRKYIAYAKRNCFPTLSAAARERIREFYVDLRAQGSGEDAPVPVTARKLEALIRLAEASARIRLSDTVEEEDAERVIEIVRSCLQDVGMDPETGEFDADVVETGTSKSQRDRIKNLRALIAEIEDEYEEGAPIEEVMSRAGEIGMDESKVEHEIEGLKQKGEVYEPSTNHLRTT